MTKKTNQQEELNTKENGKDTSVQKGRVNRPTGFVIKYSNPNSCDLERMKRIKSIMANMIANYIKKTVK